MTTPSILPTPLDAKALADLLQEDNVGLLKRCLAHLGEDRCATLLEETLAVEAQGGCLRRDGQRRTPGGTFFFLGKQACTAAEWRRLSPWTPPIPRPPRLPRVVWSEDPSPWHVLTTLKTRIPRAVRGGGTMKLTFVGVPGKLEHDQSCVLFRVLIPLPKALPKGLPALRPDDSPPWTVVVPGPLWHKSQIATILKEHPEEKILCEGVPVLRDGHCFLFATSIRSLWLEKQKRDAKQAAAQAG